MCFATVCGYLHLTVHNRNERIRKTCLLELECSLPASLVSVPFLYIALQGAVSQDQFIPTPPPAIII
jgi:hypothetical protein